MADSDVIEFECPRCLATVRVAPDQSGKRVDCPECEGSLLVPSQSASPDLFDDIFDSKPVKPPASSTTPTISASAANPKDLPPKLEEIDEDDLLSNLVIPGPANLTEKTIAESADADPFKIDPDAPIKIDGMGDVFSHDDVYGIKCNICDTRIHVRPEQAGSHIKCPECYSDVLVKPQSETKAKPPKWQADGRGQFTNEPEEELKLSAPVERPDIDESFGLAPVTEDMLAPKAKTPDAQPEGDPDNENGLKLAPLPDEIEPSEEPALLEIMDDDEPELESGSARATGSNVTVESETPLSASLPKKSSSQEKPATKKQSASEQQKSRRQRYEESQRRQSAAEAGTVYRPTREESESTLDRFPEFETGSLFAATIEMLRSPGMSWRVAIALALMCFGSIMTFVIWPIYVPAAEDLEEAQTGVQKMWMGVQWTLFGVIPYMIGLAVLWYTSGFIFREAALGNRQIKSWKSKGGNETLATFLVFGFGFFIGGLPAAFMQYLVMPLRMILSPLLLLGAWHGQSAFSIVNVDAFKNMMKQSSHWVSFYIFMALMGLIGLFGGLLFEFRRAIPYFAVNVVFSVFGVAIVVAITLAFAAVCGWNCGWVVEELEESS